MIKATYNGFDDNTLTIISTSDTLNAGEEYCLKVIRSNEHFNYFWKCMQVLGDEIGYSAKDMKRLLFIEVFHFTDTVTNKKTGVKYIDAKSVADGISKKRLNEIMIEVEKFYAEHGYIMPEKPKELEK